MLIYNRIFLSNRERLFPNTAFGHGNNLFCCIKKQRRFKRCYHQFTFLIAVIIAFIE